MTPRARLSIRRKLGLLVLLASALALACVAVAVVFYEATSFRPRASQQLQSQGTVLGEILQPALDFADPAGAARYLKTYRQAQRELAIAAVYDANGRLFASDAREDAAVGVPPAAATASLSFTANRLSMWQPIARNRQVLGHLYLVADLPPLPARLPQYSIMAGGVLLALAIVGVVLIGGVQRNFLVQLAALVQTTGRIASDEDYSIRAPVGQRDELGQLAQSFNQMIEVIDRREGALRESEERMRRLASATFEGIFISEAGRILEVNEQGAHMFGREPADCIGRLITDFVAPESRALVQSHIGQGIIGTYESTGLRADGSMFRVEARTQELFYQGRPARVSALRDITERTRAEEALRRSEEKFSKAFLASPTALIVVRLEDARVIEVSAAFERLSGYSREEAIGRTTIELGIWANPEERPGFVEELLREGSVRDANTAFRSRSGTVSPVRISSDLVVIGADTCSLTTIVDLTERERAEAERARLEEQLQQAQKMEAVGRLAGGVAHDFNNMLTVILGQAELALLQVDPDSRMHASLLQIQRAGQHSANLTRQLLTFARRQTVVPKVLDLNATVSGMLRMLQRLIGEDINLVWRPDEPLWPVKIDPAQVDQILANLCVNARDAIAGVGNVTIETSNVTLSDAYCADHPDYLPGRFARLAVSDDGRGIDKETLQHIFEPFFTTKNTGEGTGLGLATVFGIVKQNEGFLTVYSEPRAGTTFSIYLPMCGEAAGDAPVDMTVALPRGLGETLLLVEDEPAILDLGREMLESLGYTVITAGSPREAIRIAEMRAEDIRLLITDVVMPEMNGRDLAERITAMKPGLRCLYVSGYTASVIAGRGVLDEGTRFLQKPFSRSQLAAKVRDALDAV